MSIGMGSFRRTRPTKRFPEGRWEARWYDDQRQQRTKVFSTKADALRFVRRMEADRDRGAYLDPNLGRTRFREAANRWLAGLRVRQRTRAGYVSLLKNHVLPAFGNDPVASISRQRLKTYIVTLENSGVGAGTIRNVVRNVLKPVLDVAVDDGMIRSNPCARLKLRSSQRTEMYFLSPEEVTRLADAMEWPPERASSQRF
jgi:integrase